MRYAACHDVGRFRSDSFPKQKRSMSQTCEQCARRRRRDCWVEVDPGTIVAAGQRKAANIHDVVQASAAGLSYSTSRLPVLPHGWQYPPRLALRTEPAMEIPRETSAECARQLAWRAGSVRQVRKSCLR